MSSSKKSVRPRLDACGEDMDCFNIDSCNENFCRMFDVSVPVTVTPYGTPETCEIDVRCAGEMEVTPGHRCCENEDPSFEFTLTQRLIANIPVQFGSEVCVGKSCAEEHPCYDR